MSKNLAIFEQPLKNTSTYLGMTYLGMYSYYIGADALECKESQDSLNAFIEKISH